MNYAPTFTPARYAKHMIAVHCPSDGTGMKTRAMRLCGHFRGRYSGRERAYIMSPTKAVRLQALFTSGWDAHMWPCERELIAP